MQQNTTYVETTMNVDHYWNIGVNEDGHHKVVQMTKSAGDVTIATSMDNVIYSRDKTAAEVPSGSVFSLEGYLRTGAGIMQLLGIRACVIFDVDPNTQAVTINYKHNVSSVVRNATGKYTVNYASALPSNRYMVICGGIRQNSTDNGMFVGLQSANTNPNDVKSTGKCELITVRNESASLVDPLQAWAVMFGG